MTVDYSTEIYDALGIVISKPLPHTWRDQLDHGVLEWEAMRRDEDEDMKDNSK